MKKAIMLVAAALLSTATFAQTTWKSDKYHSKLQFTVTHLMVSDVDGEFKDFDATIVTTKPDFSDAKFSMTANTASVNTDAGFQVNGIIKRADFNFGSKFGTSMLSDEVTIKANGEFGVAQ